MHKNTLYTHLMSDGIYKVNTLISGRELETSKALNNGYTWTPDAVL